MAKPLSGASPEASSSSSYTPRPSKNKKDAPRRRWGRSTRPPLFNVAPSSGVLSFLASIVSATPVDSNPVPLSFLCPSIDGEDDLDCSLVARASPATLSPAPTKSPRVFAARRIPDRFTQEADGIWRRVDSYTLYGSTMPSCASGSCSVPTGVPSSVDDQIKGPDTTTDLSSSTNLSVDDLPPGWKPLEKSSTSRTALILAVSLVLAFLICSTIVGCLFWRKKVQKSSKDPERAKRKKKRSKEEEGEALVGEKEMKVKQKIWARATARWKANVRHSARQRRRISRITQANQSSVSIDTSRSYMAPSLTRSRSSSRSSTDRVPVHQRPTDHPETPLQPTSSELSIEDAAAPALPPAYQHRGLLSPSDNISAQMYSGLVPPSMHGRSLLPSHSSSAQSSGLNGRHPAGLFSAHVATDDKQFLARLADMASAPPSDESLVPGDLPGSVQASVPTWHDEDISDFEACLASPESHPSAESSRSVAMFPPPPSKERLILAETFDYSYTFNDLETPELEPSEPSAPPFEECAAPLAPSAPPLLEDGDADSQPSAPEWDSLSLVQISEERPGGLSHDRIATASTTSLNSAITAAGPSSRDSIVLPVYRP